MQTDETRDDSSVVLRADLLAPAKVDSWIATRGQRRVGLLGELKVSMKDVELAGG